MKRAVSHALRGLCLALALTAIGCTKDSRTERNEGKTLRVILRPGPADFLPRDFHPIALDREIAAGLAEYLGLEFEPMVVEDYDSMIDLLLAGEADLIAAGLTITDTRQERVAFSLPYLHVDELLVTRKGDETPELLLTEGGAIAQTLDDVEALKNPPPLAQIQQLTDVGEPRRQRFLEVGVRPASSYYQTLIELQQDYPALVIREMPETMGSEEIVDQVASGELPATAIDSHYWKAVSGFYDNLSAPIVLAKDRPIALALPPDQQELRRKVNEYLIFRSLSGQREETSTDDFDGIQRRKRLRVLTRNNASTYFIHQGVPYGFEYELIEKFAKEHRLQLEMVIPPTHADLIPWLIEGKGDLIAAAMTITPERSSRIAFSRCYLEVDQVIVVRNDDDRIHDLSDLATQDVILSIRESNAFLETIREFGDLAGRIQIDLVPEDVETETILAQVESGERDVTICDSHFLALEQSYGRRLKAAFRLREAELGWGIRKENRELRSKTNAFVRKEYKGLFYNILVKRYFSDSKFIAKTRGEFRSDLSGRISPYDEQARAYATELDLDWRLLVSLMYEESQFDPTRVSWAGAQGLMQLMPTTARELGVQDPTDADDSIRAGALYLRRLIDRFDPSLPLESRIRFALASYNAGLGHVRDARSLARRMGWSPDRWSQNVEQAMRLLQKPDYYEQARFGYCRGSETARYVRAIEERYRLYVDSVPEREETSAPDSLAAIGP